MQASLQQRTVNASPLLALGNYSHVRLLLLTGLKSWSKGTVAKLWGTITSSKPRSTWEDK